MNRNLRLWTVSTVIGASMTLMLSAYGVTTSTKQPTADASLTKVVTPVAAGLFCQVQMPASWKSAITSGKVTADGTWSMVEALAPTGDRIVKEVLNGSVAHLELGSPGGKQQIITNIANTQAGGFLETVDFDGRWVVYVLGYDQQVANPWAMYAWDSKSGNAPRKIASSQPGAFLTGDPEAKVQRGEATWLAGSTTSKGRAVHLFDLAHLKDQVVGTGNVGSPFFVDNVVVWPEINGALKAYNIVTGGKARLPDALKAIQNSGSVVGNLFDWVWTGGATHKQLWMWRTGWGVMHPWTPPKKIFDSGKGSWISGVGLAGNIVTWSTDAAYAADLRSGSYVQLTPQYGISNSKGTRIALTYNTTTIKSEYMANVAFVVDPNKLPPLPRCPASK